MNNQMRNAAQRGIIVTVLMSYNGLVEDLDKLNDLDLDPKYFDGYFKAVVKARQILKEKNPIVNDFMVEDFLEKQNYLNLQEWCNILTTNILVYDLVVWYYDMLKDEYIKRMAL